MSHIVLTPEQMTIVLSAPGPVEARDEKGRTIGRLTPLDAMDRVALAHFKRDRTGNGPPVPSAQVQAHLRRLEEIRQAEGLDEAKMLELLHRMQSLTHTSGEGS